MAVRTADALLGLRLPSLLARSERRVLAVSKPSDRDIYATALLLIRKHGRSAAYVASQKADKVIHDPDGLAMWKRVLAAIDKLEADPPAGSAVH